MYQKKVSERKTPPPKSLPFGWKRAQVMGAFFNGVFLLALGVSILLQAIERFTQLPRESWAFLTRQSRWAWPSAKRLKRAQNC